MINIICKMCKTVLPLISEKKKIKVIMNSARSRHRTGFCPDVICPECLRILIPGKKEMLI